MSYIEMMVNQYKTETLNLDSKDITEKEEVK